MSPRRTSKVLFLVFLAACSDRALTLPLPYRDLVVPEARLMDREARERGRRLFLASCALCHGERGDGHGPRATSLSGRPADLTSGGIRGRLDPRTLYYRIREGIPGSDMPAWKSLESEETWDLVAYLLDLAGPPASPLRTPQGGI